MLTITFTPFCVAMAGLGIIAIAGVVVSNNIVLIDTFQELINKQKMEVLEAVKKTALSRLRPVLITTTTTIMGLIPMMFNFNIDFAHLDILINSPSGQWWEEMATTIAGGVFFSLRAMVGRNGNNDSRWCVFLFVINTNIHTCNVGY